MSADWNPNAGISVAGAPQYERTTGPRRPGSRIREPFNRSPCPTGVCHPPARINGDSTDPTMAIHRRIQHVATSRFL